MLPRALPYIVSGFELGDNYPINTGLDFTPEQIVDYAHRGLPLFDSIQLPWNSNGNVLRMMQHRMRDEQQYQILRMLSDDDVVTIMPSECSRVLSYIRHSRGDRRGVFVGLNLHHLECVVELPRSLVIDTAVSPGVSRNDNAALVTIRSAYCIVLPVLLSSAAE